MERRGEDFRGFWRIEEDLQRILEEGHAFFNAWPLPRTFLAYLPKEMMALPKGDDSFAKGDGGLAESDDSAIAVGLGVNGDGLAAFGFILDVA